MNSQAVVIENTSTFMGKTTLIGSKIKFVVGASSPSSELRARFMSSADMLRRPHYRKINLHPPRMLPFNSHIYMTFAIRLGLIVPVEWVRKPINF